MKTPKTLFLAWKDPISPNWFTIGRLTFDRNIYQFVYTQGVKEAEEKCAFTPLLSFPRLDEVYTSTYLFPVFANRVMSRSRPDYSSFIEQLDLLNDDPSPMAILARSGGERVTDTFAVFPDPENQQLLLTFAEFLLERQMRSIPENTSVYFKQI